MIDMRLPCYCRDTKGESCRKCDPPPDRPGPGERPGLFDAVTPRLYQPPQQECSK